MPLPLHRRPKPQQVLRNLLPRRPQHINQRPGQRLVVLREQRNGQPLRAGTSRAADAVHVVFDRQGERDVDDGFYEGDVEAAGRDVGGDEEGGGAGFEGGEGGGALFLGHVAVDGGYLCSGAVAAEAGAEEGFDAGGFFFVEAEDEDAGGVVLGAGSGLVVVVVVFFDELEEAGLFLAGVDDFDELGDLGVGAEFVGGVVGADGDVDGVMHEGGREVSDGWGPGGGEHEGLPALVGSGGDDLADFFFEAFVEHAVCFI